MALFYDIILKNMLIFVVIVYHIFKNKLSTAISERKVPETWEPLISTNLQAGKIFCMYVCMYTR